MSPDFEKVKLGSQADPQLCADAVPNFFFPLQRNVKQSGFDFSNMFLKKQIKKKKLKITENT